MLIAISNGYIQYTVMRINDRIYDNTATNMDRQRQTDYAVMPRERYIIMMQTLYKFRYSHKCSVKLIYPVRRNDMCSEIVLGSMYVQLFAMLVVGSREVVESVYGNEQWLLTY